MKNIIVISLSSFLLLHCFQLQSQNVQILKVKDLKEAYFNDNDSAYVLNFWATWCKPCVNEMPELEKLKYSIDSLKLKVKIILVSLDFKEDLKKKLIPFLKNKQWKNKVVLLDESNAEYFIPLLHQAWTGAIPATMIIQKAKVIHFFERTIKEKELLGLLPPAINGER
jgi:thiol-disulfide isomerase/thioredoxin